MTLEADGAEAPPVSTTASLAFRHTPEGALETTEMAALAARFINSTARHVFLTGKAGTGKTTFLHQLVLRTHKRFVITAPTGIAALNAKGVTLHSQFLLPFGSFIPERQLPEGLPEYGQFHDRASLNRRHPLNALRRNVLRAIDLLIIDEVSMLRADLLDAVDHRLRSVRGAYHHPFGGVQLLLIGDLFQLPPVVKDDEWNVLRQWYANPHFFEARGLKEAGYAHVELDRIFRQQDGRFIHILNNLRNNTVSAEDVETLNAHYRPHWPAEECRGVITLTTHNRTADELNQRALDALPGHAVRFHAQVTGDFPQSMFPAPEDLLLKPGAQVMFIRNDADKAYFNGKLAKITAINKDEVSVEMLDDGSPYTLKRETWQNKRYVVNPVSKEQQEEVLGTFSQYPVKVAWAITVHKSQGLTFGKAIIDVGNAFAPGQVYVALSRLRSLEGLMLRTRIDPAVVTTDKEVLAFSERQFTQQPLPEQLREQQRLYVENVLHSAFDLGDLLKRMAFARKDNPVGEFEDEGMRSALERLAERLQREEAHTRTFRAQLLRLLQGSDRDQLLDRIAKGAAYYGELIQEGMKELLRHLAQVEQLSRTKQYADDLREIDGLLVRQCALIAKAGHIARCILNGEEPQAVPETEKELVRLREALVAEVAHWALENRPTTKGKTGRKRKRSRTDEVFGDGAKEPRKAKAVKGETYRTTFALLKEGKTLDDVARERQLSLGTIEGHAAKGIEEGVLDIADLMEDAARDSIADWMREHPKTSTQEARQHFDQTYSYGQLRMVQAWLKAQTDTA